MIISTKRLLLAEWSDSETKELSTLMNNIEISDILRALKVCPSGKSSLRSEYGVLLI
jgi:hypothetical protein